MNNTLKKMYVYFIIYMYVQLRQNILIKQVEQSSFTFSYHHPASCSQY